MSIKYDGFSDIGGVDYQIDPISRGVRGSIQFNDGQGGFAGHPMSNVVVEYNPVTGEEYANIYATNLISNAAIDYENIELFHALVWDGSNWVNHFPEEIVTSTGADVAVTRGQAVYVSGGSGATPRISPSISTDPATMPSIGITIENGSPGDEVHVATSGVINVDLPGMTAGNTVYVSNTAPGGLMDVRPRGGIDLVQNIGIVVKGGTPGKLLVTGVGRTNDVPNTELVSVSDTNAIDGVYVRDAANTFMRVALSTVKTFVIPHPNHPGRLLVHGCLEGPEGGVYYRGKGNSSRPVRLPDYVPGLITGEPTIHVTPIGNSQPLGVSEWDRATNTFRVIAGRPTDFHWTFTAMRTPVDVEPFETGVEVKGQGPYRYI